MHAVTDENVAVVDKLITVVFSVAGRLAEIPFCFVFFQSQCGVKLKPAAFGFASLESLIVDMKDSIEMTYKCQGK